MSETMNLLEKVGSLLQSRRLWVLLAQGVAVLIAIVGLVAPVLDYEVPELPDEEALAARLESAAAKFAALLMSAVAIFKWLSGAQQLSTDYTFRPAGTNDRIGTQPPRIEVASLQDDD
jgi:hypothetical protein